jgi:molybdopterin molybdotransferase
MGLLAGQGMAQAQVWRKPRIAILSTGSELMEPGQALHPAKIYNSNLYTLSGYLIKTGTVPVNGGIAADAPALIAGRIRELLPDSEMVITTGGASVGDYDWAVRSAELLGAEVLFRKVGLKPGGAMMAAVKDGKLILGLSGNPAAAATGLLHVALPYVKKLCGRRDVLPQAVETVLKNPFEKRSPQLRILRGRLELGEGTAWFVENAGRGNGLVSSLMECDLLGEVPAGSPPLPAGARLKAYRV